MRAHCEAVDGEQVMSWQHQRGPSCSDKNREQGRRDERPRKAQEKILTYPYVLMSDDKTSWVLSLAASYWTCMARWDRYLHVRAMHLIKHIHILNVPGPLLRLTNAGGQVLRSASGEVFQRSSHSH